MTDICPNQMLFPFKQVILPSQGIYLSKSNKNIPTQTCIRTDNIQHHLPIPSLWIAVVGKRIRWTGFVSFPVLPEPCLLSKSKGTAILDHACLGREAFFAANLLAISVWIRVSISRIFCHKDICVASWQIEFKRGRQGNAGQRHLGWLCVWANMGPRRRADSQLTSLLGNVVLYVILIPTWAGVANSMPLCCTPLLCMLVQKQK